MLILFARSDKSQQMKFPDKNPKSNSCLGTAVSYVVLPRLARRIAIERMEKNRRKRPNQRRPHLVIFLFFFVVLGNWLHRVHPLPPPRTRALCSISTAESISSSARNPMGSPGVVFLVGSISGGGASTADQGIWRRGSPCWACEGSFGGTTFPILYFWGGAGVGGGLGGRDSAARHRKSTLVWRGGRRLSGGWRRAIAVWCWWVLWSLSFLTPLVLWGWRSARCELDFTSGFGHGALNRSVLMVVLV
jgi:hypothetical protein